jgi:hypothetical protein
MPSTPNVGAIDGRAFVVENPTHPAFVACVA